MLSIETEGVDSWWYTIRRRNHRYWRWNRGWVLLSRSMLFSLHLISLDLREQRIDLWTGDVGDVDKFSCVAFAATAVLQIVENLMGWQISHCGALTASSIQRLLLDLTSGGIMSFS